MALCQEVEFSPFSNWHLKINSNDIVAAGEDFAGTYETSPNHMRINVRIGAETYQNKMENKWSVEVQSRTRGWDKNLALYARRTGKGSGSRFDKAIKGGEVYREVGRQPFELFSCQGWRYDIPIQFELRGVSVLLPAKTYSMELIFTIIDD